jgi:arabinogalactan endo-1,4-beta-galactosidase
MPDFRYPLSASYFAEEIFEAGVAFDDGERRATSARELQEMFVAHGANELAVRIGTSRHRPEHYDDDTSLDAAVERARMAVDLGLPLNPLLFLSRHYGDVTGQPHPVFDGYDELRLSRPWPEMSVDEMSQVLRRFAEIVATAILDTGVRVSFWNLGNEVDLGICGIAPRPFEMGQWDEVDGVADWYRAPDAIDEAIGDMSTNELLDLPDEARSDWLASHVWPHEARLLEAAASGIRAVDPEARFSTHVGQPTRGFARAFFEAMKRGGYAVDQIGISMYPSMKPDANEAINGAFADIAWAQQEWAITGIFQEFGYPAGRSPDTFADEGSEVDGCPLTEEGQATLVERARHPMHP